MTICLNFQCMLCECMKSAEANRCKLFEKTAVVRISKTGIQKPQTRLDGPTFLPRNDATLPEL